jgi:hypothetical protein
MTVALAYTSETLPGARWDREARAAPLRSGWLRTQSGRASAERYLVAPDGAGIATFFLWRGDERDDRYVGPLEAMGFDALPALVCVSPGSELPGFSWPVGKPLPANWLIDTGESLAAELGAATLAFSNLDREEHGEMCCALERAGFAGAVNGCDAVLDLTPFDTFADYLASLPRNTRGAVRREIREVATAGIAIERWPVTRLGEDLVPLQVQQHERYGQPADPEAVRRKFASLQRDLEDWIVVLVAGDPPVGYVACLVDEDVLSVVLCGVADAAPRFTYFNLVYYEVIALCLERGLSTARFGTESYEAKRRRGCRLVPLLTYARSCAPGARPPRLQRGAPQ